MNRPIVYPELPLYLSCSFNRSQGIEEGNLDMLDNSDFVDTDIPLEVPVPENQFLPVILC